MDRDTLIHLEDEGTEITVNTCLGDLSRVLQYLHDEVERLDSKGQPHETEDGLIADLYIAKNLIRHLVPDSANDLVAVIDRNFPKGP